MKLLKVVVAIITDKDRRLLFQRRKRNPYKGYLGLVGGKLEPGETLEEALLREINEETSLTVIDYSYLGQVTEKLISNGEITEVVLHVFNVKTEGEVIASEEEGSVYWIKEGLLSSYKNEYIPVDWHIINSGIKKKKLIQEMIIEHRGGEYEIKSYN